MTTAQTIRLSESCDLLALVPYRLGFHPAESAVLVTLTGTPQGTRRVGLVARMDLSDLDEPSRGPAAAAVLAGHVAATEPDEGLLVLYTDTPDDSGRLEAVVAHLTDALDAELWPVAPDLETWVVGPDGWAHLDACDCCPAAGRPLAELSASAGALAMVVAGYGATGRRSDLGVERVTDTDALGAAHVAAEEERRRRAAVLRSCGGAPLVRGAAFGVPGARPARDQLPLERWREDAARLWDGAVASAGPGPAGGASAEALGRLLVALGDKVVRDAVVAAAMVGGGACTAEFLDPDVVVRAFETETPPDLGAVGAAIALAHRVAAHAPPGDGGPALGLLAYLAWWGNEGARADVVARQALAEEPGHRLAELVVAALDAGVPPAWVGRR
ncbi:uncharacterized protein DUF4192 [Georgenia soli]|uniref:Uncharacterized protein DUF4192 n=1 Tax=Georgenia soli TaxID=638953 RepID=A0A2A9EI00_9MICO|nr:DUF4192 domain-containing protein [Georgenia soli]PFG37885.1 uncharacterized protein DUF4192 [Georgenia soli]